MEIGINKSDLKDIDYIINHFVENNKHGTISIPSLVFCLQKLIDGRDELAEALKEEDD